MKILLSCTPFMILEHIMILFRMCIFHSKGPARQNQIVCWARSPGDHALHVTQFPIEGVNYFPQDDEFPNEEDAENFNTVIEELIEWEKKRIEEAEEEAEDNQDPEEKLKQIEDVTLKLEDDIRALTFQIVKE